MGAFLRASAEGEWRGADSRVVRSRRASKRLHGGERTTPSWPATGNDCPSLGTNELAAIHFTVTPARSYARKAFHIVSPAARSHCRSFDLAIRRKSLDAHVFETEPRGFLAHPLCRVAVSVAHLATIPLRQSRHIVLCAVAGAPLEQVDDDVVAQHEPGPAAEWPKGARGTRCGGVMDCPARRAVTATTKTVPRTVALRTEPTSGSSRLPRRNVSAPFLLLAQYANGCEVQSQRAYLFRRGLRVVRAATVICAATFRT